MSNCIPEGYRVSIDSSENDGDNQRTLVFDGLSKERAQFYVDFAKLFYCEHNYRGPRGFGNMYEPDAKELEKAHAAIRAVFIKHWEQFSKTYDRIEQSDLEDPNAMWDISREFHSQLFGYGEFHFRYLNDLQVEYIPVRIEIKDVTKEFMRG